MSVCDIKGTHGDEEGEGAANIRGERTCGEMSRCPPVALCFTHSHTLLHHEDEWHTETRCLSSDSWSFLHSVSVILHSRLPPPVTIVFTLTPLPPWSSFARSTSRSGSTGRKRRSRATSRAWRKSVKKSVKRLRKNSGPNSGIFPLLFPLPLFRAIVLLPPPFCVSVLLDPTAVDCCCRHDDCTRVGPLFLPPHPCTLNEKHVTRHTQRKRETVRGAWKNLSPLQNHPFSPFLFPQNGLWFVFVCVYAAKEFCSTVSQESRL